VVSVLEVLLRRELDGRLQHDSRLDQPRPLPLVTECLGCDALARARGDLGGGTRHGDHLPSFIELDVFLSALAISTIIPVMLFLVLQRMFLHSAGFGGAVKG
jgi:hypothetical protein